jgi:DNA processing protein
MTMSDLHDFVDLLSIKKMTERRLYDLLERYKSPERIKHASGHELAALVGPDCAHSIISLRVTEEVERAYEIADRCAISSVPYYASGYPSWLRAIPDFPPVLFVRGTIQPDDETALAIIGTRGATVYGKNIAEQFAAEFVAAGATIISGMARGVDTAAHASALKHGGRTIAVLGCGVDRCYPPENRDLMRRIIEHGAVISEFAISTPPLAQNFPKRNRIVSGLAKAVIAIEAKEKSGVMNTVNWAASQNKDVYAIPGNIYSKTSCGTNRLIKEGAIPVTSAQEVLELCGFDPRHREKSVHDVKNLDEAERMIWQHLTHEPIYLDVLSESIDQPTGMILNTLLALELKGMVKQLPGMMFVKTFDR